MLKRLLIVVLFFCFSADMVIAVEYSWEAFVDNDWAGQNWWNSGISGPPASLNDVAFMRNVGDCNIGAGVNGICEGLLVEPDLILTIFGGGTLTAKNALNINHISSTNAARVNLTGVASAITISGAAESALVVGHTGTGELWMDSGTVETDLLRIGFNDGSSGLVEMHGGDMTCNTNLVMCWSATSDANFVMDNDANLFIAGTFFTHGGGTSHILLDANSVLSTDVLWTGFFDGGDSDIDIWGGKLIVRSTLAFQGGTFNIDISNTGELIIPLSQKPTLQSWITAGDVVGFGGTGGLVLTDDPNTTTVTAVDIPVELAKNPVPANGATGVAWDANLSWDVGQGAIAHDVYFGTDAGNLPLVSLQQAGITYDPGILKFNKTYFWRIDEYDGSQTHTGLVWNFTTAMPDCIPAQVGDLDGDCKVSFVDFAMLTADWLTCNWVPQTACDESNW